MHSYTAVRIIKRSMLLNRELYAIVATVSNRAAPAVTGPGPELQA